MIHHVSLETRRADVDACVAFWAGLGFAEVAPPETLRDRARWVQRGEAQVHFLFAEDPVVMPRGHVAVVAADYAATLRRLREDGYVVEERRRHWGAQRHYVRDPAGHLVELMEFPP